MSNNEQEILVSLKILVCMAMADGILQPEERTELQEVLEKVDLPAKVTVESLLAQPESLEALLPQISSPTAQEQIYQWAYTMAYIDQRFQPEEQEILEKIKTAYKLSPQWVELVNQSVVSLQKIPKTRIEQEAIANAQEREEAVQNLIKNCSIATAVLGLNPIPGIAIITNLVALGVDLGMMNQIGEIWGYQKGQNVRDILQNFVGGLGALTASIGVGVIVSVVPVVNSITLASTHFVFTWAIGQATNQYYASGKKMDAQELKQAFQAAKKEGKLAYRENQEAIAQKQAANESKISSLNEDLKAGKITQVEYQEKIQELF
ncbi:MAG: DUF533 domain-containing protein [Microcoleaceae cyanobacterium MO_207.B10]|nr:DUF533 domain-containing protein [Microcoleaceae cyanobacterium MO_207.B10]